MIRRLRLWLSFRRTLIATVVARTDQRDDYREHALEALKDRDWALREACRYKAERDVARQLAADLARHTGFASTLHDIQSIETGDHG